MTTIGVGFIAGVLEKGKMISGDAIKIADMVILVRADLLSANLFKNCFRCQRSGGQAYTGSAVNGVGHGS